MSHCVDNGELHSRALRPVIGCEQQEAKNGVGWE